MNCCCQKAKNYLKNIEDFPVEEIKEFIDSFNSNIKEYSNNGISTFLLECVEVCLELSESIKYLDGEVYTRWIKGKILLLGGHYSLAGASLKKAFKQVDKDNPLFCDVYKCYSFCQYCLGNISGSIEYIKPLLKNGFEESVSPVLSGILTCRGEDELSYSFLEKCNSTDFIELLHKMHNLLCLDKPDHANKLLLQAEDNIPLDDNFFKVYLKTIKLRISLYKGEVTDLSEMAELIDGLSRKRSFYHYIDGLLNIAEIYLKSGDITKGRELLDLAQRDKRNLKALDCRIFKLLEYSCLEIEDFKGAYNNSCIFSGIIKNRNAFNIDKSLRDLTPYLYKSPVEAI